MKSLEIIKRKINEIYGFDDKWEEVEELEQIKQDLEVLEIIRKILFNRYVISDFDGYESGMENPIYYLELEDYDKEHPVFLLEQEEKDKLKQWLEVNENV